MGLKAIGLSVIKQCAKSKAFKGPAPRPVFPQNLKPEELVYLGGATAPRMVSKTETLMKYCADKNLILDDVTKCFTEAEKHLDSVSVNRLLKLTRDGKITLYTPPQKEKKVFIMNRHCSDRLMLKEPEGILNYVSSGNSESSQALKQLLALEKEGKISAENILELLKMQKAGYKDECAEFIAKLRTGEVTNNNVLQAELLVENDFGLDVFNPKNLCNYSKEDLANIAKMLQASHKPLHPDLLANVSKELMALIKVNKVAPEVSTRFLNNFEKTAKVFGESKHSIDDLAAAGGIELSYSREAFKSNILSKISPLPEKEQARILEKFGLNKAGEGKLSGLPVYLEQGSLNSTEAAVNLEIKKFLTENKVVLPKGFEEYQAPLEEICAAFPECRFTIGSIQHKTHSKALAEHILMAFQENMRNPLYKELNATDKKVLGISTILHDINKVERTVDPSHPFTSSQSANAIVNRMEDLLPAEKDRIINFIENHHWLQKIQEGENFDPQVVKNLAFKFRSGNDFTMAKIFAESDLKAVNTHFYNAYGSKINSPMTKAIEEEILQIQSKGRLVYTTDVTLNRAIASGATERVLGEGKNATRNFVADAKSLRLDKENFFYHAGRDESLICAASACGYGKELVLSASLGREGHLATYNNIPEFLGFRSVNMNNIGSAFVRNTKYGKSYDKFEYSYRRDENFVYKVRKNYGGEISDKNYALLFREASGIGMNGIHANKNIQKILGGEENARKFEEAVKKVNNELESSPERFQEAVIADSELGFLGTKRKAGEIGYNLRKFCEENKILIVEFK